MNNKFINWLAGQIMDGIIKYNNGRYWSSDFDGDLQNCFEYWKDNYTVKNVTDEEFIDRLKEFNE